MKYLTDVDGLPSLEVRKKYKDTRVQYQQVSLMEEMTKIENGVRSKEVALIMQLFFEMNNW